MDNLRLDDFLGYSFLSDLSYSPSGDKLVVAVSKVNGKNGYNKALYADKGQGFFPLTRLEGRVGMYAWLDDDRLLFSEVRDKDVQAVLDKGGKVTGFHSISLCGGEAVPMFDVELDVSEVSVLPGGAYIMLATHDTAEPPGEADEYAKNCQAADELPFWADGGGFVNGKRGRLYSYTPGAEPAALTDPALNVEAYRLSPCGGYALVAGVTARGGVAGFTSGLYLLDIRAGGVRPLLTREMMIYGFDFAGEGFVLAASYGDNYSFHEHPTFYRLDEHGGMTALCKFDRSVGSCAVTDSRFDGGFTGKAHGGYYYFTSLDGFVADVYRLCLSSGEVSNVTHSGGNVNFFDVYGGAVAYGGMIGLGLQEVYEIRGGVTEAKSGFNSQALEGRKLVTPRHHVIAVTEHDEVDGWVMPPADYVPGRKYPAVLNIHGGPKMAYCGGFFHEMQCLAARGFFVMFCNPRGSDGKGNAFADIRGKYGTIDYDDIQRFADEMCGLYADIDTARLGVMGGSYGGYMTNLIISRTDRFAAAVSMRGICNWVSMACTSDIGHWFVKDQLQADPWTDAEKLWQQSPLKHAPGVTTPTLILHSDADYRCCVSEAYQWFTALKLHGTDTRLCVFHDESHNLSRNGRPHSRLRRLQEIADWMGKYLS
ncbi:MAG: S9 family peptidase [Defluviitaleaceae bacterium]|nr:S9 family peptidase [Defluviitaleaceae bacterium]